MATLGLARAYALSGNRAQSINAYQRFLTLWKDADPGSPLKEQAAKELSRSTTAKSY